MMVTTKPMKWLAAGSVLCAALCFAVVACEDNDDDHNRDKVECTHGKVTCGGTCVDLASNPDHCGACGLACSSSLV